MRRGFFQSTTFRLALALLLVQVAALALGLTVIHRFTAATILSDARTAAEVARDDFAEEYRQEGEAGLVRAIRDRLAVRDDRNFVVLLKGPDGTAIAGNLKQWPATVGNGERWRRISLFREGGLAAEEMGIVTTPLEGGRVLLTGEVLEAQAQLARASQAAFLYALAAGILLAAIVAWVAAWILARRVDAFARAASAIAAGKLDARVERDETGDAFDRLGTSINAMLERIEALVGELRMVTDSMAHDLRSPVSRMKATLEQALGRTRDAQATVALAGAIDEADSLHRLLDTALEISRAEAGIGRDQFAHFALAPLLEDLAEVYGPLAEDEGFAIAVAAPADLAVVAHREMLLRALSNLIDNALKYAVGGSTIRLAAAQNGSQVALSVSDDGPGISEDQMGEAARRFVRLDPARGGSGAGLGLSLVETIAHMHGGTMTIGRADPHGMAVTLRLPIASD
ncbi:HAMP domain-containing histidine kinase [Sphingopyxis sp. BSN-002]|uniref:sensor histidine kinase n=1 Tax=Sphingopyxis sp. BSN-002 TaxID=2911495 RepID=UPI001EDB201B|nr:HAMP domain-containing sensor histidine kinase [Sphingopyxis sp. BSN-002]UKK82883.1 HAMP domain-containing histidine kinase [Sphingopyxis sp. BSN-002]